MIDATKQYVDETETGPTNEDERFWTPLKAAGVAILVVLGVAVASLVMNNDSPAAETADGASLTAEQAWAFTYGEDVLEFIEYVSDESFNIADSNAPALACAAAVLARSDADNTRILDAIAAAPPLFQEDLALLGANWFEAMGDCIASDFDGAVPKIRAATNAMNRIGVSVRSITP